MNVKGSVILRKEIVRRFKENNFSYYEVSKYFGVKYSNLIMWLNANEGGHERKEITETFVIKLCVFLGIEIVKNEQKVQIILHDIPTETFNLVVNKRATEHRQAAEARKRKINEEFFRE